MIDIDRLKKYFDDDAVIITIHAQERLRQRGIRVKDIRACIMNGEIIEQYPGDFPFPSCLVFGHSLDGKIIHVVISDEGTGSRIITAYIPDTDRFEDDLKTRKEKKS